MIVLKLGPHEFGLIYKASPDAEPKGFIFDHRKADWAEVCNRVRDKLFPGQALVTEPGAPVPRSVLATPAAAPAPIPQQARLL